MTYGGKRGRVACTKMSSNAQFIYRSEMYRKLESKVSPLMQNRAVIMIESVPRWCRGCHGLWTG